MYFYRFKNRLPKHYFKHNYVPIIMLIVLRVHIQQYMQFIPFNTPMPIYHQWIYENKIKMTLRKTSDQGEMNLQMQMC